MKLFMGVQLSGNINRNIYVYRLYVCMYVTVNYKKESRRGRFNRLSLSKARYLHQMLAGMYYFVAFQPKVEEYKIVYCFSYHI